jgi:hypothetical protein
MTLYVARRKASVLVLAPASDGIPELLRPQPLLVRVAYLTGDISQEDLLVRESGRLGHDSCHLMLMQESLDGPPNRMASIFTYTRTTPISWRDGAQSHHGLQASEYRASTLNDGYTWGNEARSGRPAYFLTGSPQSTNLWRVARVDIDVAQRYVFTLAPVRLPQGLPSVDFSPIEDAKFRSEANQHWNEFQDCLLRHRYYGVVTAAKNVAETVLAYYLLRAGESRERDFSEMLKKLRRILEDDASRASIRLTFFDYHLMSKLRILHARTHPGRVIAEGRRIGPGLALSVAEDLIEVLTSLELTHGR